jgi:hypothetical protein
MPKVYSGYRRNSGCTAYFGVNSGFVGVSQPHLANDPVHQPIGPRIEAQLNFATLRLARTGHLTYLETVYTLRDRHTPRFEQPMKMISGEIERAAYRRSVLPL